MKKIINQEEISLSKIKEKFDNRKLVFFFGAGCSSLVIPLIGEESIFEKVKSNLKEKYKNDVMVLSILNNVNFKEMNMEQYFNNVINEVCGKQKNETLINDILNILNYELSLFLNKKCNINPFSSFISLLISFLKETSEKFKGADIFTVNYDDLIEKELKKNSSKIHYNNGFDKNSEFKLRNYIVPYYSSILRGGEMNVLPHINLFKIHGSIDWKLKDKKILKNNDNSTPAIIIPTKNKYNESLNIEYFSLLFKLKEKLLNKETTLIIAGYSFGDEHINGIIKDSMVENPHLEIIYISYDSAQNFKNKIIGDISKEHNQFNLILDEKNNINFTDFFDSILAKIEKV